MSQTFTSLNCTVLTVSDTRTEETDKSGKLLAEALIESGHQLMDKRIVKDDIYQIRAEVCQWVADPAVQVIVLTGGTGFAARDSTPEAIAPLLDKEVIGFGELFRQISYEQIGNSTLQSRALAGLANKTLIFCLPGSTNACQTAWTGILKDQLDNRHQPCNFVGLLT